jgi:hypothetical protein
MHENAAMFPISVFVFLLLLLLALHGTFNQPPALVRLPLSLSPLHPACLSPLPLLSGRVTRAVYPHSRSVVFVLRFVLCALCFASF